MLGPDVPDMCVCVPDQVPDALKEMLGPDAPDVCIEAVGFHYMNSWLHKVENALLLETDTSEILNELIYCCRKVMRLCCLPTSPLPKSICLTMTYHCSQGTVYIRCHDKHSLA